jgi:hypothetical protein
LKIYKLHFIQGVVKGDTLWSSKWKTNLKPSPILTFFCYTCQTLKKNSNLTCKMLSFVKAQILLRVRHPWQTLEKVSFPCGYFHNEKNIWIYYILCSLHAKYFCKAYNKQKIWKGRISSKLLPQPRPYLLYILSIKFLVF